MTSIFNSWWHLDNWFPYFLFIVKQLITWVLSWRMFASLLKILKALWSLIIIELYGFMVFSYSWENWGRDFIRSWDWCGYWWNCYGWKQSFTDACELWFFINFFYIWLFLLVLLQTLIISNKLAIYYFLYDFILTNWLLRKRKTFTRMSTKFMVTTNKSFLKELGVSNNHYFFLEK